MAKAINLYRSKFNPLLIQPDCPLPDEVAVIGAIAVFIGDDDANVGRIDADRMEAFILPPQEVRGRDVALGIVLDEGQEEAQLNQVVRLLVEWARPREKARLCGPVVEPCVADALHDGGHAEFRRPVVLKEGLKKIVGR